MKGFICIHCGTVMSSKCPHQRSVFYGPEIGMIRNALATHVLDVGPGHKEVFLNLSFWGENTDNLDPVIETIKTLSEWKDKLIACSCDHHFILNSETETKCQLGCEHDNLTNKKALLRKHKKQLTKESEVTFESVKETYSDFLSTQISLARENMKRLCPDIRQAHPQYDKARRWYFVFQEEMDHIKYEVQNGLHRLGKGQPYRKKYEVSFGYKSDIPRLRTDDIFQAEAVYKHYQRAGIKCTLGELRHEKKDSTNICYYPMEQDPNLRLRCCECKEFLNPGDATVIAELVQEDGKGREIPIHNHGEVMHRKCHKKIVDKDKEFHRMMVVQLSNKEMESFNHFSADHEINDITTALRDRMRNFRYMQVTESYQSYHKLGTVHGRYNIRVKGIGRHFDELKLNLKPAKETKS